MTERTTPWTPGPWLIEILSASDPNGDEWETDVEVTSESGKFIHGHDLGYGDDEDTRIKANARLIATAPEMADIIPALIVVALDHLDDMDTETRAEVERDIETARAALAKARGEQ